MNTPENPSTSGADHQTEANRTLLQEIMHVNHAYTASFGDKKNLVGAPQRKMAIVTCMDARMDPAKICGLKEGDAHVIRNAGGRVTEDVIRSLVVSAKLMGTTDWFVIHHTSCGMQSHTAEEIQHLLGLDDGEDHTTTRWHNVWRSANTPAHLDWMTFGDLRQSVIDDVERIRVHPLVPEDIRVYGYIYHIHHGSLELIAETSPTGSDVDDVD